jgi:N utilization substance protein B
MKSPKEPRDAAAAKNAAATKGGDAAKPEAKPKSARRRAREFALQGLYAWQMTRQSPADIEAGFAAEQGLNSAGFGRADRRLFSELLAGAVRESAELEVQIRPALDRDFAELSPVERAVLLLGAYELKHALETPYRVIINEAIELAKSFGGTDGHKYVNGVLDKLVKTLRPHEAAAKP